ncbi:ubiquitin-activating enzyme E1-like protein [Phanerochaete sordida]|uniref:Ubiquitin-activating enzyme E1-like n=1 Tax=Phanerochaete sordida TaxID=48140 RepID=A0A9P3LED0_9APHY|nr:ubiquitin-activating enzyme E1-like protein [Phanerochaete sordida]
MSGRSRHATAILGPELAAKLPEVKVLLVGAGGIGCEVLKNIVLAGFGNITLLDLDTIDLSNLNRQFLFRKKDVKQSKAMVAAKTASAFNPNVRIQPIHGNIKEPQFDVSWFRSFDLVLNALDNLDARRHVNKMCMAANVPLMESGTAGYLGQVQPIVKDKSECFDCVPKPTPKTFPVCTIRSTPSQPIHCIVWAKSYLIPQLFGEDEDSGGELDEAEKQGENAQEIATLRKEAQAFKKVRAALRQSDPGSDEAARLVFNKVFHDDINNLLSMADMWRNRAKPTPLEYDGIKSGSFSIDHKHTGGAFQVNGGSSRQPADGALVNGDTAGGSAATEQMLDGAASTNGSNAASSSGLKDQRTLTLRDSLELFVASTKRLAARLRSGENTISFDKDDDDTLDFVTAGANLRAAAYGISGKSRWEVKEMAGNIIPAIATTNAIIAGLVVLQALHLLRKTYNKLRNVHVQFRPSLPLSTISLSAPNPRCGVCRDTYAEVLCEPSQVTLRQVVEGIIGNGDGEDDGTGPRDVSVYEAQRVLSDPDWDDNLDRDLESMGVTRGKFLSIVDEDGEYATIQVAIGQLPPNHPIDGNALMLPYPLPRPPRIVKPKETPGLKRAAPDEDDDDDIVIEEPPAKRMRPNPVDASNALPASVTVPVTPSKKRKLDEDGILLLETKDEVIEDDDAVEVIELD